MGHLAEDGEIIVGRIPLFNWGQFNREEGQ